MKMEESVWDDIVAGNTNNPVSELAIKSQVKEEIVNGKKVILTILGEPYYFLQLIDEKFIKTPLNQ